MKKIDENSFKGNIELLRDYSIKIKEISRNNDALVDSLNNLSATIKQKNFEKYQNANGPINTIRKEVSRLLKDRAVSKSEIETIINIQKANAPDKFRIYKGWYNLLYTLILADANESMIVPVQTIINFTIDALEAKGKIKAYAFDFRGPRNTGSDRCWIAFINHTHPSQTTAKQLFLEIHNGNVEFCYYNRPLDEKKAKHMIAQGTPFNTESYISVLNQYLPEILEDEWTQNISYWRVGTRDGDTSYWEEMKSEEKICIGWPLIGDLKVAKVKSQNDIYNLLEEKGYYLFQTRKAVHTRKAGEIFNFYSIIKPGDIVLAQDGFSVLGIARVEDEYQYNPDADFPHQKGVKWLTVNPDLSNNHGNMSTVYQITNVDKIKEIKSILSVSNNINQESTLNKSIDMYQFYPLNQILYGPPGTGKTYNTINKAISIIDGLTETELEEQYPDRQQLKKHFNELLIEDWDNPKGQIAFVTFHQSMCYEEFVEGIKPETNNGNITYDIESGIFKKLADLARNNWNESLVNINSKFTFDDVLTKLEEEWENDPSLSFPLRREGKDFTILGFTKTSIRFKKASGGTDHTLTYSTLRDYFYGTRQIQSEGLGKYYQPVIDKLKKYSSDQLGLSKTVDKKLKPYVLIIDEINRGNVSQIFGELITLIEEDKRLGKDEALEAFLPYSKERFGIPPNLYIIGTMNTADRSVEALDTALRRRFCFQEISPKPDLLENTIEFDEVTISLKEILEKINERIELLLDKDHLIGHSYFMKVDSFEKLQTVFHRNILPLLQEYFFGDYGKIGLTVGRGFIEADNFQHMGNKIFANFEYNDEVSCFCDKTIYRIKDCSPTAMNKEKFIEAIQLLLN